MSILKKLVADAVAEIHGVLSGNQKTTPPPAARAAETDGHRNFAPVTARGDAAGDTALALRSSNEEPRPGDRGLLPGTARPGPGTHPASTDPGAAQGILGDVDWDVLTGGDAAVRILGDDGRLIERRRG